MTNQASDEEVIGWCLWWLREGRPNFRLASLYPTREDAAEAGQRMAYLYPVTEARPQTRSEV